MAGWGNVSAPPISKELSAPTSDAEQQMEMEDLEEENAFLLQELASLSDRLCALRGSFFEHAIANAKGANLLEQLVPLVSAAMLPHEAEADNEPSNGESQPLAEPVTSKLHSLYSTPSWQCQSQLSVGAVAELTRSTCGDELADLHDIANTEEVHSLKRSAPSMSLAGLCEARSSAQPESANNKPADGESPLLAVVSELQLLNSTPSRQCQSQHSAGAALGHTDATRGGSASPVSSDAGEVHYLKQLVPQVPSARPLEAQTELLNTEPTRAVLAASERRPVNSTPLWQCQSQLLPGAAAGHAGTNRGGAPLNVLVGANSSELGSAKTDIQMPARAPRAGQTLANFLQVGRQDMVGEQGKSQTLSSWLLKQNGRAMGVVAVESEASSEGECTGNKSGAGTSTASPSSLSSDEGIAGASTASPSSLSSDEGAGSSDSAGGETTGMSLPLSLQANGENLTTLVLRRLPARCSQNRLLKFFPPDGSYDFLFAPYSAEQRRPCRYCFINFTSPSAARAFVARWHGQYLLQPSKGEPLDAQLAEVQGLRANVEKHKHLASAEKEHHPAVFRGKRRVRFEELVATFAAETAVAALG